MREFYIFLVLLAPRGAQRFTSSERTERMIFILPAEALIDRTKALVSRSRDLSFFR
jgi:hypothetical protein